MILNPPERPSEIAKGEIYETDRPVSGNRHAEMGLVFLALTTPDYDTDGVDLLDFLYDDCRYIYGEYLRMKDASIPAYDKAAQVSWFKRSDAIQRMKEHHLDWFDDEGKPIPYSEIFQLVIDGGFATIANIGWYKSEVRRWRVIRAVRYISHHLRELIDADEAQYHDAILWLEGSLEKLKQLEATIKPQEGN